MPTPVDNRPMVKNSYPNDFFLECNHSIRSLTVAEAKPSATKKIRRFSVGGWTLKPHLEWLHAQKSDPSDRRERAIPQSWTGGGRISFEVNISQCPVFPNPELVRILAFKMLQKMKWVIAFELLQPMLEPSCDLMVLLRKKLLSVRRQEYLPVHHHSSLYEERGSFLAAASLPLASEVKLPSSRRTCLMTAISLLMDSTSLWICSITASCISRWSSSLFKYFLSVNLMLSAKPIRCVKQGTN